MKYFFFSIYGKVMDHLHRPIRVVLLGLVFFLSIVPKSSADRLFLTHGDLFGGKMVSFTDPGMSISATPSAFLDRDPGDDSLTKANGSVGTTVISDARGSETGSLNKEKEPKPQKESDPPIARPIGVKPAEEDIRKIFLRQASVLLQPGQGEMESGVHYLGKQTSSAVLNVKLRQFQVPLTLRFGLLEGLEGHISTAYLFSRQELSFAETTSSKTKSGWGDTILGGNYELVREKGALPQIILILRVKTPTGEPPKENELALGSGHWGLSLGLQCIKTSDPLVLFWGIQYTHEFAARHYYQDGLHSIRPGDTVAYNLGFGFAVNENISLSTQVLGSYQGETSSDGISLSGTATEPVSFRSALTYRWSKRFFIEPSLTIGLNEDAPDFTLALSFTYRF